MTEFSDPLAELEDRAEQDSAFREQLLADPRGAIESVTGLAIPADWRIAVTVDDADQVHIGFVDDAIPGDYLALVAGGGMASPLEYGNSDPRFGSCPALAPRTPPSP